MPGVRSKPESMKRVASALKELRKAREALVDADLSGLEKLEIAKTLDTIRHESDGFIRALAKRKKKEQ